MALTEKLSAIGDAVRSISGRSEKLTLDGIAQEVRNIYNFAVCGNPQPASPKENTIWVNTDTTITGWIFSETQPENLTDGMVWFLTGTYSTADFNALKKNGITVYPLSAKQYVGGELLKLTAKTYQDGAWVDWWNGELFYNGNQYIHVTGGWEATVAVPASISNGQMVFNSSSSGTSGFCHKDKISRGSYTKIGVNLASISASGSGCFVIVVTRNRFNASSVIASKSVTSGTGNIYLDISNVNEEFYVYVYTYATASAKVNKIWME